MQCRCRVRADLAAIAGMQVGNWEASKNARPPHRRASGWAINHPGWFKRRAWPVPGRQAGGMWAAQSVMGGTAHEADGVALAIVAGPLR